LRQWALAVLKQTMNALEGECLAEGKGPLFREVKGLLSGERDGAAYAGIGQRLAMADGAVRVAVHRLRQRYGKLLGSEIAQTVSQARRRERGNALPAAGVESVGYRSGSNNQENGFITTSICRTASRRRFSRASRRRRRRRLRRIARRPGKGSFEIPTPSCLRKGMEWE
jgi:hypothetical protein